MGSGRIPQTKGKGPLLLRLEDCTLRQPLPHPLQSAEPPEKRGSSPGLAWSTRRRAGEEREWEGEMRAVSLDDHHRCQLIGIMVLTVVG
jgi:hypothetical protein